MKPMTLRGSGRNVPRIPRPQRPDDLRERSMVLSGVRTSAAMSRLGSWGRSIQTSLVQTRRLETDDDTPAFVLGTALSCGGRHECARRVAQEERATAMRCLS